MLLPQQCAPPSANAQTWSAWTDQCDGAIPATGVGGVLSPVGTPTPNMPSTLRPQHLSVPLFTKQEVLSAKATRALQVPASTTKGGPPSSGTLPPSTAGGRPVSVPTP